MWKQSTEQADTASTRAREIMAVGLLELLLSTK